MGSGEVAAPAAKHGGSSDALPLAWLLMLASSFAALALYGFLSNQNFLFYGLDGVNWEITMGYQSDFRSAWSSHVADPLQGMFDAYFPAYNEYYPWWWAQEILGRTKIDLALVYLLYFLLLLWSVFMTARMTEIAHSPALLAGVALPILCMPIFFGVPASMYPIMALNPHVAYLIFLSLMIVPCVWLARRGTAFACLAGCLIAALVIVAAGAMLPHVVLMVPAVAVFSLAAIAAARDGKERARQIGACFLAVVLIALSGLPYKLYVISQYTVPGFFADELLQVRREWSFVSMIYHDSLSAFVVVSAWLGALASMSARSRLRRSFAAAFLLASLLLQLGGAALVALGEAYQGPSLLYFEFFLWPHYMLFGALLWWSLVRIAWRPVSMLWLKGLRPGVGEFGLVFLATAGCILIPALAGQAAPGSFRPLDETPIIERLERDLSLSPGQAFRGYAATFAGAGAETADWYRLHAFDGRLWQATANDMRTVGLWLSRIPTLFHYSTLITPQFYLMASEFLSRPGDRQMRSAIVFSRADERMLRLWGVRFVISDNALPFGSEVMRQTAEGVATLRLYELTESNRGQYAPTTIVTVEDFRAGMEAMRHPGFDPERTAVLMASRSPRDFIDAARVPVANVVLTVARDRLHLRAESNGKTLLVLPTQYSHCWTASDPSVSLLRVNLLQLGVAYEGNLDAELRLEIPAFGNPTCRMEDLRDMTKFGIRHARDHHSKEAAHAVSQ